MFRINNEKTTSYRTGYQDFVIDIIESIEKTGEEVYNTWLYRENTGAKIYVVGELKTSYPGYSTDDYARHIIKYIRTRTAKGYTFYSIYDEEIEDIEIAANNRIKAEKANNI